MGHADDAFRQDQQRVPAGDAIIGLGGVIGIAGTGKAMNAPGRKAKRSLSVSIEGNFRASGIARHAIFHLNSLAGAQTSFCA
jgi:hypothetical protein